MVPDVAAPADSALERAHAAALRRLAGAAGADSARARMLRWVLEGVLAGTRFEDAGACAALAGRYEGARVVRCAGGRLRYSRGGNPERGLVALGGGDYLLEGTDDVRLRFERAGDGAPMLRVLDADGTEVRAPSLSAAAPRAPPATTRRTSASPRPTSGRAATPAATASAANTR